MAVRRSSIPATDDRFLRRARNEQVRKSRRARTVNRLVAAGVVGILIVVFLGSVAWGGHHFLTHSERFTLRKAVIAGATYTPQVDIRKLTDTFLGQNLFAADLSRLQDELEELAWVQAAHPKRRLPDTLLVQIVERVPAALIKRADRFYLADAEGRLLDELGPKHAAYDFPVLTGLDQAGRKTLREKVRQGAALAEYLSRMRPAFARQVSQIDLSRDDRFELRLSNGGPPIRLNPVHYGLNLDNYLSVRNLIDSNYGRIQYVDLRWKDRISIMPAAGRSSKNGAQR